MKKWNLFWVITINLCAFTASFGQELTSSDNWANLQQTSAIEQSDDGIVIAGRRISLQGSVTQLESNANNSVYGAVNLIEGRSFLNLFDPAGGAINTIQLPDAIDESYPTIALGTDRFISFNAAIGSVEVRDFDGQTINEFNLFKDAKYNLEKTVLVKFSANGQFFVVAGMNHPPTPLESFEGNIRLVVFSSDGDLVWDKFINDQALQSVNISPDGNSVAISSFNPFEENIASHKTTFFNDAGIETQSIPVLSDKIIFHQTKNLALLSSPRFAKEVNLSTEKITTLFERQSTLSDQSQINPPKINTTNGFGWPLTPFNEQHRISGTFCEFRGPDNPHFHDGVDIPKADGSPVYAVLTGKVTSLSRTGSNAYVRVGRFAYVHISPKSNLAVGDSVYAYQTVIGNILTGLGHVHFKKGYGGSELNAISKDDGLDPYEDPWVPILSEPSFRLSTNGQLFPNDTLAGTVKIIFKVAERNAEPGTSTAGLNNGAYYVGYKILTRDRSTVVYSPTDSGIQFQFDNKPSNSYVLNVFDINQASTYAHYYIVTNKLTQKSYFDTGLVDEGEYTVMLFAGDTRDNETAIYRDIVITHQDLLPPAATTLHLAGFSDDSLRFRWEPVTDPDLAGYRIYSYSPGGSTELFLDENTLTAGLESYELEAVGHELSKFHITTVDSLGNESGISDRYGAGNGAELSRILIVDGFDRTSGSWSKTTHDFAWRHGDALYQSGFGFSTVSNEAATRGYVNLTDFDAVIWTLGDESTVDVTFGATEKSLVKQYLDSGGYLFVNGSEIAWDLGNKGSAGDQSFLSDYLKVSYAGDDAGNSSAKGVSGGIFEGMTFSYGSTPYDEDYPDYFSASAGGSVALKYGNDRNAGVLYEGSFGDGDNVGKVFTLGFPFETISGSSNRNDLIRRLMIWFFPEAVVSNEKNDEHPTAFTLSPAYPNPFNGLTTLDYQLPEAGQTTITVYDLLGRQVQVLMDGLQPAGRHKISFDGQNLSAGVYFVRLKTQSAGGETVKMQSVTKL